MSLFDMTDIAKPSLAEASGLLRASAFCPRDSVTSVLIVL